MNTAHLALKTEMRPYEPNDAKDPNQNKTKHGNKKASRL